MPRPAEAARARVLADRAAELARPVEGPGPPVVLLLRFTVAGAAYAVGLAAVREVLAPGPAARLPLGASGLGWIVNCRGELLPVADTARLLDPALPAATAIGPVVVVAGASGPPVGLAVDEAPDLAAIPSLMPPPATSRGPLLLGAMADGTAVLDAAALLADPRLRAHRETAMDHPPARAREPHP